MNSRLPFLHMGLSLPNGKKEANLFVLKDSGCERSIISVKLLKKLDLNWMERMKDPDIGMVKTASGHMTKVLGAVDVHVRFQSIHEDRKDLKVLLEFLIVADEMTKKAYLGADFLQDDRYKPEENNVYITVAPAKEFHVAGPRVVHAEVFYKDDIEHTKMIVKDCVNLEPWESKWCDVEIDNEFVDEVNLYEIHTANDLLKQEVFIENMGVHLPKRQKVLVANRSDTPKELMTGDVIASCSKIEDDIIASFEVKMHENPVRPEFNGSAAGWQKDKRCMELNHMDIPKEKEILIGKIDPSRPIKKGGYLLEINDLQIRQISQKKTITDEVEICDINLYQEKGQENYEDGTTYIEEKPEDMAEQCVGPHFDLENTKEDTTKLRDKFNTSKLSPEEREELLKIIEEFPEVWAKSKLDIGGIPGHYVKITTDGSVFSDKFRPFPKGTKDIIMKIINTYIDAGIFEIAPQSPYAMNLFLARKPIPPDVLAKDPDAINNPEYFRCLLDGRSLNKITTGHSLSLGQFEDLFLKIGNAKYLIMIDIVSAFFNVKIRKEDRVLTSFYTPEPGVKVQYKRLPQGLKNAQLEFCSLMTRLLKPIEPSTALYVDDIAIFDTTFKGICDVFRKALQIMKANNIKLLPHKTSLLPESIKFLGIHWSRSGVLSIPKAKIQAFSTWPTPLNTKKKIQSFCSAVQFFRKFIDNLSGLMKPLTEMLKKDRKIKWDDKAQNAFKAIVASMERNVSLHVPFKGCTFELHTDASKYACAARLCFIDKEEKKRLVACSSRTFSEAASRYSTFHQELLGLVFAIRSFEGWIAFSTCVIYLDCISLTYLALTKNSTPSIMRISIYLSQFGNFTYIHVRSANNMADSLTRNEHQVAEIKGRVKIKPLSKVEAETILKNMVIPDGEVFTDTKVRQLIAAFPLPSIFQKSVKCRCKVAIPPTSADILGASGIEIFEENEYEMDYDLSDETMLTDIDIQLNNTDIVICSNENEKERAIDMKGAIIYALTSDSPLTGESMKKMQQNDTWCQEEFQRIKDGKKSLLQIGDDGVLYSKKNDDPCPGFSVPRPALPDIIFRALMFKIHSSIQSGAHGGPDITEKTLRQKYFIPNLKEKVREYCDNCIWCQIGKKGREKKSISHGNIRASTSMEIVAMDLAGSFPKTGNGEVNILLMVDLFSAYSIAIPMVSKKSPEILRTYLRSWELPYGKPRCIRSDGECGIVHGEFEAHCKESGIITFDISSGSSWVNGAAEKKIANLKEQMAATSAQCPDMKDWEKMIVKILNVNNNSVRSGKFTAAEIMFGRRIRSPFDIMPMNFEYASMEDYTLMTKELRKQVDAYQNDHLKEKFAKMIESYNKKKVEHHYKIGDFVWLKNVKIPSGTGNAFRFNFTGPFRILEIVDNVTAWIIHIHVGKIIRRHFNFLKPVTFDEESRIVVSMNWDINLVDEEVTKGPRRSLRNTR